MKEGATLVLAMRREESVRWKIIFCAIIIVWKLYDEINYFVDNSGWFHPSMGWIPGADSSAEQDCWIPWECV